MLPAGVEIRTPSEINFFIIIFLPVKIDKDAACLLCLRIETSLIAINFFKCPFLFLTFISKGDIDIKDAFDKLFIVFFAENLFIKKP